LPLPFALRAVNVYLIDGGSKGRVLVDAGLGLPADERALHAGLAEAGVEIADITAVVLTHAHPDHIGLCGAIVAASGAPVYMLGGEDQRMFLVWGERRDDIVVDLEHLYASNGLPSAYQAAVRTSNAGMRRVLRLPPAESVVRLRDGQELALGGWNVRVLWTPGHADYHCCLLREDGVLLVGDHVLPRITPNIGLYPRGRRDPLGDYFNSLARIARVPARLTLPGHGRPFVDLEGRAAELRVHHIERSEAILTALRQSELGLTAGELAGPLFGPRLRNGDDWRFAVAETLAHLEHLRQHNRVRRRTRDGLVRYAVVRAPKAPPE
jgi:glyoxylase-like metal-dependent hydrolase (beta-lactamase superfamily II)